VVSVLDILGPVDPERIMALPLPFVMDLIKAKIRLEESKSKAQKAARALEEVSGRRW
jgi:hypothetical protein